MKRAMVKAMVFSLTLVPALVGVTVASAASTPRTALPHVLSCAGKSQYEPSSYTIYCADANARLLKVHWTSWSSTEAKASATYSVNDCTPNCAAGMFHSYAATATLSVPKTTKYGKLFTQLTVVWAQNKKSHHLNYPLPTRPL
jgi:hypothetical protein